MKPPKHTIQWIAPHLSEGEVKTIYEAVKGIIGIDETRLPRKSFQTRKYSRNELRAEQRKELSRLFGRDNK